MAWPYRALAFLVFSSGRTDRRWFALGLVATLCLFTAAAWLASRAAVKWSPFELPLVIVAYALLWSKCALTARRLHDFGWPGGLNFPGVLVVVLGLANRLFTDVVVQTFDRLSMTQVPGQLARYLIIAFCAVIVSDLVLCLVPGSKRTNRYGPRPGQTVSAAPDVF